MEEIKNPNTTYRVVLDNGQVKDYSQEEYDKKDVAQFLYDNANGQYSVFKMENTDLSSSDALDDQGEYRISVNTPDGRTAEKLYSGKNIREKNLINDFFEKNYPGQYTVQSVKGFRDAFEAREGFQATVGDDRLAYDMEVAKSNLDAFEAKNGSTIDDYDEAKDGYIAKFRGATVTGDYSSVGDIPTKPENYDELVVERKRLRAEYLNNPLYRKEQDALAEYSTQKAEQYKEMENKAGNKEDRDNYNYARKFDLDAAQLAKLNVGDANDNKIDKTFWKNMATGAADTFTDRDFWTMGITEIARNNGITKVIDKINDSGLDLENASEHDLDNLLTESEKALLGSFIRYSSVMAERSGFMPKGYSAGQTSAEAIDFMAQFFLTGGVAKGITNASIKSSVKGTAKGITKVIAKYATGEMAKSVVRGTTRLVAGSGKMSKGAKALVKGTDIAFRHGVTPVVNAALRTPFMTNTYVAASEDMLNRAMSGEDIQSTGLGMLQSALNVLPDQIIENWSEGFGETISAAGHAIGSAVGKKLGAASLGKLSFEQMGKAIGDTWFHQVAVQAGFNGLVGEMLEEWAGNAARVVFGAKDSQGNTFTAEDFAQFADPHQQLEMAISFAPLSILGLGSSTKAVAAQKKQFDTYSQKLRGVLERNGMSEDEIANIMDTHHSRREITDALAPVLEKIASSEGGTQEDYETVLKFASVAGAQEVLDAAINAQQEHAREGERKAIGAQLGAQDDNDAKGKFTHQVDMGDGNSFTAVTTVTDANGNAYYYIGTQGTQVMLKNQADGSITFMDKEQYDGKVGSGELKSKTQSESSYLDERIEKRKVDNETRQAEQFAKSAKDQIVSHYQQTGNEINIGTEENPVNGRITNYTNDGIIVEFTSPVEYNGSTKKIHKISYDQAGQIAGIDTTFLTEQDKVNNELDAEERDRTTIKNYNNQFKDLEFVHNGTTVRYQRMTGVPFKDENGNEMVKIVAEIGGNSTEITIPLSTLTDKLTETQKAALDNQQKEDGEAATEGADQGTPKDFRGNPIPMKFDAEGNQTVDVDKFFKSDPEAYLRWNDSRRGRADSQQIVRGTLAERKKAREVLVTSLQGVTVPSERDAIHAQIDAIDAEIKTFEAIQHKYEAEDDYPVLTAQFKADLADLVKKFGKGAIETEDYIFARNRLVIQYLMATRDSASAIKLAEQCRLMQAELDKIEGKDVPVVVATYADIMDKMKAAGCTEGQMTDVMNQISAIIQDNMLNDHHNCMNGFHINGQVFVLAEGQAVRSAVSTYYHERQHTINASGATNAKAEVAAVCHNSADELKEVLLKLIGPNAIRFYETLDVDDLADEVLAFTLQEAYTKPNYKESLKKKGLSDELINVIDKEYGRQNGRTAESNVPAESEHADGNDNTDEQEHAETNGTASEGESADEQSGSIQPGDAQSKLEEGEGIEESQPATDIDAQIAHLEGLKKFPAADKKLVQAEIDRLKAEKERRQKEGASADAEQQATSLLDVIHTLYTKGKEYASKIFQRTFFDVVDTPEFMKQYGLTGSKFTIRYGVITRHWEKDKSHNMTEREWEKLPEALQNPFAITKLKDKENGYRLYTTLQNAGGEYIVVGVDVKNAGHDIEVNAISTVFGRRTGAGLTTNEEVIYRSPKITPEQSSLLGQPNSDQYPTEQESSSEGKGSNSSEENNAPEVKSTYEQKEWSADSDIEEMKDRKAYLDKTLGYGTEERKAAFPEEKQFREDSLKLAELLYNTKSVSKEEKDKALQAFQTKYKDHLERTRKIHKELSNLRESIVAAETKQREEEQKADKEKVAEERKNKYHGYLQGKSALTAASIEKALEQRLNFVKDGRMVVMTVVEFIEKHLADGDLSAETKDVQNYPSGRTWNRMDNNEQARWLETHKPKTEYFVNGFSLSKTAYEYAKWLLDNGQIKQEETKEETQPEVKSAAPQAPSTEKPSEKKSSRNYEEMTPEEKWEWTLQNQGAIEGKAPKVTKPAVSKFKSPDKQDPRAALRGVYHDGGYEVASDGCVLVAVRSQYDASLEGKITTDKGEEIQGRYPKWRSFLEYEVDPLNIDINKLAAFIQGAKAKAKEQGTELFAISFRDGKGNIVSYNGKRLEMFVNFALYHKCKVGVVKNQKYTQLSAMNADGSAFIILMPVAGVGNFIYDDGRTKKPLLADEVFADTLSSAPEELKGRITVRESSTGDEQGQNFIQDYDIDGKPSGIYRLERFDARPEEAPTRFVIEGSSVDAGKAERKRWEKLALGYIETHLDVRFDVLSESGLGFFTFKDAYDFLEWVKEQSAQEKAEAEAAQVSDKTAKEGKKKDATKSESKIDDYGERIAGARKDMLRDIAKTLDNATMQSLVELPFSKVFKRPDLRKMVENGTLREKDARFVDAVIFNYLSIKKPVGNTKNERRLARYGRETNVQKWAKYSYQGIEILKSFFSADEETRDAIIEKALGFTQYGEENARKEQEALEKWNPGKTYDGDCYPINNVRLFYDVMERLGYPAGQKIEMPVIDTRPDGAYSKYVILDKTKHCIASATSYDAAVDKMVYLTKVANADEDTEHPREAFRVRGENRQLKVAGYRVRVAESLSKLSRDRYALDKVYPTKEEAQKITEEYKAKSKDNIVLGPDEVTQHNGYEKYGIYYVNPLTSTAMKLGREFETAEEAEAAIDAERETLNAKANEKIAEEANKAGTKREDSWFEITYYWDAIEGGEKSGKSEWRYAIQLADRFTTTRSAMNTMPIVMAEGFKTREEAQKALDAHKEEWKKYVQSIIDARRNEVFFGDENESRTGEDYRGGRDVTEKEFGDTFGFRGVQFGNWTNQKDRQAALNNAYDSFMDLAKVLGVSPKAISLNGELGIAFGARGSGGANAHYESGEVVINLTKPRGAGSLAHEWWHALDNYFSRSANVPMGFATDSKSIQLREEMRNAFNQLIDDVNKSDYHTRSKDRGASYWGTTIEETARLFAEWVRREMAKNGERNPFLVRGITPSEAYAKKNYSLYVWSMASRNKDKKPEEMKPTMTFEEFLKTPMAYKDYVYPTEKELETLGDDVRNIFDVMEERRDENTGKVALYSITSGIPGAEESIQSIIDKAKADGTYMKAPNGKPTNLSERQWAQVRTKSFKKWFGDWEKALRIDKLRKSETIENKYNGEYELERSAAKRWMLDNIRGEYTNGDTGETIAVSKIGVNEVISHGVTSAEHLKSLFSIPEIIEKSIFVEELSNQKDNDKYDSYRYYVSGLKIDGVDYTVKMVVGVKDGNKYYDHHLTEIEKGALIDRLNGLSNSVANYQNTLSLGKDTKLISILQNNSSKVVDENGEPKVVLHLSENEFTVFGKGMNTNVQSLGFFTDDLKQSEEYADKAARDYMGNVVRYYSFLNLRNPLVVDFEGSYFYDPKGEAAKYGGSTDEIVARAKAGQYGNYDGVILKNVGDEFGGNLLNPINDFIPFEPTQIKSATDNVGTFDSNNPDIRYSIEERDAEYFDAIDNGDVARARQLVDEAARAAGYNANSDYQGTSAFNGAAPWGNGYFLTKEERKEAWDNDEFDGDQTLGDYIDRGIDAMNFEFIVLDPRSYSFADANRKEAIDNVRNTIQSGSKTITMYRSVPADVKEGSFRNGDWVTPSRGYAEENARIHGWGDNYNVIEQKVSTDDVWWDGNDIAEWGYGRESDYVNDTDFAYKNTKNNRKSLDVITYDRNGRIIPLSERFNENSSDVNYSVTEEKPVQGLELYTRAELKGIVDEYVEDKLAGQNIDAEILGVEIHGSRNRGDARADSDLDVVVGYKGDLSEDSMFNILNEEGGNRLYIEGIPVDINPIREGESGTLDEYMQRSARYDAEKMARARQLAYDSAVEMLSRAGVPVEEMPEDALKQLVESAEGVQLMTVYHGSGARFDHFDSSHMGEGEGAQAYGWGHYVTEVEGIGRTYAMKMSGNAGLMYKGVPMKEMLLNLGKNGRSLELDVHISNILKGMRVGLSFDAALEVERKDVKQTIKQRRRYLKDIKERGYDRLAQEVSEHIKKYQTELKDLETLKEEDFRAERASSNLYTVEIPDDNGENYLDWRQKMSSEEGIKFFNRLKALAKADGIDGEDTSIIPNWNWLKGTVRQAETISPIYIAKQVAYMYASKQNLSAMEEARKVSELLSRLGYVGIKYPAEYRSGGRADGKQNYVIFKDSDLEILNRIEFLRDGETVYGAAYGDKVLINKDAINPNTPIHEYTHLWDRACAKNNPELWKRGVELMKQTSLWDEAKNDSNYSGLDEYGIASEVHSRLAGNQGERLLTKMGADVLAQGGSMMEKAKKLSVIESLKDWVRDFWSWLKDAMTPWSREKAQRVSLDEFIAMPIATLAQSQREELDAQEAEERGVKYSIVDNADEIARLENESTIKTYRAMQLHDGKLYPPMAGKVNGKWQQGIAVDDLGKVWEKADEHPELADDKGYFTLNKGNGKSLKARYNPYIHTSLTPLNDQFSEAQDRPELVTVEVEVPESELTSGYKAEKAKDSVGRLEWKAGVIQSKLSGTRTVILSRWDKPIRIVPESEVADVIVGMFDGKDITMPSNVVTPQLRAELEKRGIPFVDTDNLGKPRYSVRDGFYDGINDQDDVFDMFTENLDGNMGAAVRLLEALGKRYNGEVKGVSSRGVSAISEGKLPFPGKKWQGDEGEYHHMSFVGEDGETFVEAVPFESAEYVSENLPNYSISGKDEESISLFNMMRENAEQYAPMEFNEEKWAKIISSPIETPLGEVRMGEHQFSKLRERGREDEFGFILPTLERPDVVFEESNALSSGSERGSEYVYVKTFLKDGKKTVNYTSVSVSRDGMEVVVSNHRLRDAQVLNKIRKEQILWNRFASDSVPFSMAQSDAPLSDANVENNSEKTNFSITEHFAQSARYADLMGGNAETLNSERMTDALLDAYLSLPENIRQEVIRLAPSKRYNFADAFAQYLANRVEEENGFSEDDWKAIIANRDALKAAYGLEDLPLYDALWMTVQKAYPGKDIISRAHKVTLANDLGMDVESEDMKQIAKQGVNFSISENMKSTSAAEMYARATSYFKNRLKEGFVDMNESINDLVEAIEIATGEKAESWEDIRYALNQQSSKGLARMEQYTRRYLQPLFDALADITKNTKLSYEDVSRYVILKHAIERNEVFAKRDARKHYQEIYNTAVNPLNKEKGILQADRKLALRKADMQKVADIDKRLKEIDRLINNADVTLAMHLDEINKGTDAFYLKNRENDYGGLTSMFSDYPGLQPREKYRTDEDYNRAARKVRQPRYSTVYAMEQAARAEIDAFEKELTASRVNDLWKKINAATKETLRSQYEANMLSKAQYDAVKDQFKYYVPLRGFSDTTAEDVWSYYTSSRSDSFAPTLVAARGRKSEAENPFNWIGTMASSAIAANVKNETKLALYYFVANRPNQDLVSMGKSWYRYDAQATSDYQAMNPGSTKKIYSEVFPPSTSGLNAKDAQDAYRKWEEDLMRDRDNGLAYQSSQKMSVSDDVAFITAKEQPEHVIRCKVAGEEVVMAINSNPRAAQAVNGLLNIETERDYQAVFGKILRYMSAVNTSYNPEFWISNAMRDILFAIMSTSVNGNGVKGFMHYLQSPRKLMRMARDFREGTLGNSYIERMFAEFASNGAITGYTVINNNEYWEKQIQATINPKFLDKAKASKFLSAFQDLGEAVEQMTRFAAYVNARENGKDITEAVSVAKEITVNFNRKGSGKGITKEELRKLTRKDGKHLTELEVEVWQLVSLLPAAGRRLVMFFNAGVQGLNAMYKLQKANGSKFNTWMAGYFLGGALQAILHALFDDDDEQYLDLSDYNRRNNALLGCHGIYLKWALPQEARVLYGFGDMFVAHMLGREPNKNLVGEMSRSINGMLPVPLFPFGADLRDYIPSVAQPIVDLALNRNFMGARIYNDNRYLSDGEKSRTPKYNNAKKGTGAIYVEASKILNYLSGGDKYDAGKINIAPEAFEYIIESFGGGLLATINKGLNTAGSAVDALAGKDVLGQDFEVRNVPFLRRVVLVNDDDTRNSHVSELYYYYKEEAQHANTVAKKMKKNKEREKLREYKKSKAYRIYEIYSDYKKADDRYTEQLKVETDKKTRGRLIREQDALRKRMIQEISELDD